MLKFARIGRDREIRDRRRAGLFDLPDLRDLRTLRDCLVGRDARDTRRRAPDDFRDTILYCDWQSFLLGKAQLSRSNPGRLDRRFAATPADQRIIAALYNTACGPLTNCWAEREDWRSRCLSEQYGGRRPTCEFDYRR